MEALKERAQGRLLHIPPSLGSAILPVFYEAPSTPVEERRIDYTRHDRPSLADRLYSGVMFSAISGIGIAGLLAAHRATEALIEGKVLSEQSFHSAGYALGFGLLAAAVLMPAARLAEYFSRKK